MSKAVFQPTRTIGVLDRTLDAEGIMTLHLMAPTAIHAHKALREASRDIVRTRQSNILVGVLDDRLLLPLPPLP